MQPLLDVEPNAELELQLRFKPEADSTLDLLEDQQAQPFEPVFREDSQIAGGQICVQAGIVRASQVLYEPWVCLPISDAVAWPPPEPAPASAESAESAGLD